MYIISASCLLVLLQNLLKITVSLTVFKIIDIFNFWQKVAARILKIWSFQWYYIQGLIYPKTPKFARNRSVCRSVYL